MINSMNLEKGQKLKVLVEKVKDRLPKNIYISLTNNPYGTWQGGYKMVDGNTFGIVIELNDGNRIWFFESELEEVQTIN